ncbi:MAG: hypothetical protein L3K00_02000 [Thermoplasmata archaeon]|nr:hypothetical protein [Thermoplasmata archaeon]
MNAAPIPEARSTTPDDAPDTFDDPGGAASRGLGRRSIGLVGGVGGSLILAVGFLFLTVLPLGEPDPTFAQRVAFPVALVALGTGFLAISVFTVRFARDLTALVIDGSRVVLRYSRGAPAEFLWTEPKLEVTLTHVIAIPAKPNAATGWQLEKRGGQGRTNAAVSLGAGAALVRWGGRAGLEVTTLRREFPARHGRSVLELTILAPPGAAHLPPGDWGPVNLPPEPTGPAVASPAAPDAPVTNPLDDPHIAWVESPETSGPDSGRPKPRARKKPPRRPRGVRADSLRDAAPRERGAER